MHDTNKSRIKIRGVNTMGKKSKEPEFKFELGALAKDSITGFEGIIVVRNQWLHQCNQYGLQPTKLHEGKPADRGWFDEPQIELVQADVIKPKRDTGGPGKAVPSTSQM